MSEKLPPHASHIGRIERRRAALRRTEAHHREILARRGGRPIDVEPSELIEEIRRERDDELFACLWQRTS